MTLQIDRLNLEGYANLEHWVARLDERIEGTLLQRLTAIIQLWCAEFERNDDREDSGLGGGGGASGRRDNTTGGRDGTLGKRRGEKKLLKDKDDKVRFCLFCQTNRSCLLAFLFACCCASGRTALLQLREWDFYLKQAACNNNHSFIILGFAN